ncbi:MAG: dockerin type I repeat-containing protein, partial [Muribaculaceae bacterium]|nr:dockerin type I repeat-containing protein [Muribaculaceae bacterium]
DGLYTIEIEIAMPTEGNAEFKFVDEFGKWYGGITDGQNFLITEEQINEQTPLDLSIPGMNFELPFPGNYKLVVDRENMKLVIVKLGDVLVGDVNGDGIVNGSDVTSLYNVLLDDAQVAGDADVNGDGIVNGSDVTALYNILLGD